jgi:protein subunit release factor B
LTLQERLDKLGITEEDLVEKFVLGTGSGGQKINKTASCVYLCHIPTGIEIKCQKERSREANRQIARLELCKRLEAIKEAEKQQKQAQASKLRRQNRKRSTTQKKLLVEGKRRKSVTKSMRKVPKNHE